MLDAGNRIFTTLPGGVPVLSEAHGKIKHAASRDGLVPIGEALADLPGPVKAIRDAAPPARRGFTQADQVNLLVSANQTDPDLGFMARLMALCSLPRTNPGNQDPVCPAQRPLRLSHERRRTQ